MKSIKHVNVGTVGHIDYGRVLMYSGERGYRSALEDYPSSMPSIRWYTGTPQPEHIYWLDGLVVVAGRVLHDAGIYDNVENPSGKAALVDYPGIVHEEPPQFVLDGKGGFRSIRNIVGKSSLVLDEFIAQCEMGYVSNETRLIRRDRNKARLVADRKSIIPSRGQIRWAISMMQWDESAIMKIAGMIDKQR